MITSTTTTTDTGEQGKPTTRPPLAPIIAGVLGGAALIAIAVTLFLLRHRLRSYLATRRTNRVAFTAEDASTLDGSVEID